MYYPKYVVYEDILNELVNLVPIASFGKYFRLCAIGARICHSGKTLPEILEDEKVKYPIDYVKRLANKGHTSILSHAVQVFSIPNNKLVLYADFLKLLKTYLKGIGYTTGPTLTINFRTVYELAKTFNKEESLMKWISQSMLLDIKILKEVELSTGGKFYLLRKEVDNVDGAWVVTFVLEGVSLVLTHQLVRHKRDVEYSQRSFRYTRLDFSDNPNVWTVIPNSIKGNQFYGCIERFLTEANVLYLNLIQSGVRPEDARFILPTGLRTTIMATMYSRDTIMNFIRLRASKEAQWEIREVAEVLRDSLGEVKHDFIGCRD